MIEQKFPEKEKFRAPGPEKEKKVKKRLNH
jgi:hypothetical protein